MARGIGPVIDRIRRHHAVEHATIHILAERHPRVRLAGHSDQRGIRLYGDVPTDDVRAAVEEALRRLENEPELAVHPMCGTNLVVGGVIAAALSLGVIATLSEERKPARMAEALPRLVAAGTAAFALSRVAGPAVQQRFTTLPCPQGLAISELHMRRRGTLVMHRVVFDDAA